jgi:hypothetical protein
VQLLLGEGDGPLNSHCVCPHEGTCLQEVMTRCRSAAQWPLGGVNKRRELCANALVTSACLAGLVHVGLGVHQNSHSAISFRSRRSVSRSSEVICRRTLSSAVTRASISRSRYFLPLAVSWT